MVSMSSLDAINIDDGFDVEKLAKQFKAFKNVFVDVGYVKNCIDTLTNEELEKVIKHCNTLIERNNIEMGGV
jgi:precorrin isomerase